MKLSQELSNLCSEIRLRYTHVLQINKHDLTLKANKLLAATYAISCAAMVIGLNQLAGQSKRKIVIDKKIIRLLSTRCSGSMLIDKIGYNFAQFNMLCSICLERKPSALMNRFGAELYNALDDANKRLYVLVKKSI